MDVMLPDGNGVDFCAELRKTYSHPVLFISCIYDDVIIKALENGGDDYIVKPFSNQILHAKIQANLRRITIDNSPESSQKIKTGNLILDTEHKTVTADGVTHSLGNIDFHLLYFFFEHPRRYYMSSELYRLIWGKSSNGDTRTVMVHICNIRKMIEKIQPPRND